MIPNKFLLRRKEQMIAHNKRMITWLTDQIKQMESQEYQNADLKRKIASYNWDITRRKERILNHLEDIAKMKTKIYNKMEEKEK